MPKLTQARLAEVRDVLDASIFTSMSFSIESGTNKDNIVAIQFVDNPRFYITLDYEDRPLPGSPRSSLAALSGAFTHHETKQVMVAVQCPGDCVEEESIDISEFSSFIRTLSNWVRRIRNEMTFVRVLDRKLDEFQAELNQRLDDHFSDPTVHFTAEERDDMRQRLSDLQEQLNALAEDVDINRSEIDELKKVISDLSHAAGAMPKRTWMRSACSKFYEISVKLAGSRLGQKVLEAAMTKLLPLPKDD